LLLMRHAKSDWQAKVASDFERPLNPRGRRDAPRMGRWLQAQGMTPELVLTSPAQRAYQTAKAVSNVIGLSQKRLQQVDDLYLADRTTILGVLASTLSSFDCLLLVAHNPGLDDLVAWLAGSPPLSESGKLMTTASIAWFELPAGTTRPGSDNTRLQQLVRPADFQ
jgi:phosphohistidine phosphatase